jgi:pimeloyl-ACP methyl ester carboxylesterase
MPEVTGNKMVHPADWRATGCWRTIGGCKLFNTAHGTGAPVLVLHGFPTASYDFSRIVPLLADQYQLILFDYPGFGFSEKPTRYPYSLFTYADLLQELATQLQLTHVSILAHDIGDSVALEILRRGKPTVDRLVLLNGSVFSIPLADRKMLLMQRLLLHPIGGPLLSRLRVLRLSTFGRMFNQLFFRPLPPAEIAAFWSLLQYNGGVRRYHQLIRYMLERWEYQDYWLDALQHHRAPLALIWGMADPVATPAVADVLVQRRPDAVDIRLDRVGHYPHWEAPIQVAAALRKVWQ